MPGHWTTLRYRDGYMLDAPTVAGRVEMTLGRDGRARISNLPRPRATPQVFEARVAPWVIEAVTEGLTEAGFPDLPAEPLPLGGRITLLSLATSAGIVQVWISPAHRVALPALHRAMRMLEAIVHAASHGALGTPTAFDRALLV